jgi:hypothetical protein
MEIQVEQPLQFQLHLIQLQLDQVVLEEVQDQMVHKVQIQFFQQ